MSAFRLEGTRVVSERIEQSQYHVIGQSDAVMWLCRDPKITLRFELTVTGGHHITCSRPVAIDRSKNGYLMDGLPVKLQWVL